MFMLVMLLCVSVNSKIRRDHDELHDVAVPGLDNPDPPLAVEDEDGYEPSIYEGDYVEAYLW